MCRTYVRDRFLLAAARLGCVAVNLDTRSVVPSRSASVSMSMAVEPAHGEVRGIDPWPAGFAWGEPWRIGTAAFWVDQCRQREAADLRLGGDLFEEVVACLLGGWGIPGDVGVAAFDRLRSEGLLAPPPCAEAIESLLRAPFVLSGRRRPIRYRFPQQRAARIVGAAAVLESVDPPSEPLTLRHWLAERVPGVGLKTASWIVRNLTAEAPIAVIDVHVRRAGVGAGFFHPDWQLPRDYLLFETAFVEVAKRGGVFPGHLDHAVWSTLSSAPIHTRSLLCGDGRRVSL